MQCFFVLKYGSMKFLEKELEDIIFNASTEELSEKGLHLSGKCFRQLRIGNYGIADLVYVNKFYQDIGEPYLCINVCELKKDKAGISAFLQAVRYVKGISDYLRKRKVEFHYTFHITLIAPEIDTISDYVYLSDLICSENDDILGALDNYSVNYGVNGIEFKRECDYSLINKGF